VLPELPEPLAPELPLEPALPLEPVPLDPALLEPALPLEPEAPDVLPELPDEAPDPPSALSELPEPSVLPVEKPPEESGDEHEVTLAAAQMTRTPTREKRTRRGMGHPRSGADRRNPSREHARAASRSLLGGSVRLGRAPLVP
jgi:hypothetical protein